MDAMTTPPPTPPRRPGASTPERTILFDFDGTVSLGHGPVLAYARAAAASIGPRASQAFLTAVNVGLQHAPSGRLPGTDAIDGYDLVRLMSAQYGIEPSALGDAYLASRALLATAESPIVAPTGLAEFLVSAREHASIVLATNAPDIRVAEAIDALGLSGIFDAVYTSVGKPAGLDRVLDEWLLAADPSGDDRPGHDLFCKDRPGASLLSVGDVWVNDLAPAAARGARTALVGSPDPAATPTYRAEHLHELYPAIAAWLESPIDSAATDGAAPDSAATDSPAEHFPIRTTSAPASTTKGSTRAL